MRVKVREYIYYSKKPKQQEKQQDQEQQQQKARLGQAQLHSQHDQQQQFLQASGVPTFNRFEPLATIPGAGAGGQPL